MRILLTGSDGQLGYELKRSLPDHHILIAVDREDLDITSRAQVLEFFEEECPHLVINAAAYTAVDKAEEEPELAWEVNEKGAENLALACKHDDIRMVQISTDFVFSGKNHRPYSHEDEAKSASVYGLSKHAGDIAVLKTLGDKGLVVRTSWLYSAHGNNFVKTMLSLMGKLDSLGIISDQIGTPTWAATLAGSIWKLIDVEAEGVYHCADNGVASWYDFAVAIQEEALAFGLLDNTKIAQIKAITTEDYPTPAARPAYSVMDKTRTEKELNITLPHWRVSLRKMLKELN
ncbi:MAG: dTDP-4-dehydrorhamnose reductase [Thiotrichaceae bacterium]